MSPPLIRDVAIFAGKISDSYSTATGIYRYGLTYRSIASFPGRWNGLGTTFLRNVKTSRRLTPTIYIARPQLGRAAVLRRLAFVVRVLSKERLASEMAALLFAAVVAACVAAGVCAPPRAGSSRDAATHYANVWAVQVEGGIEEADALAKKYHFINKGQVSWM